MAETERGDGVSDRKRGDARTLVGGCIERGYGFLFFLPGFPFAKGTHTAGVGRGERRRGERRRGVSERRSELGA